MENIIKFGKGVIAGIGIGGCLFSVFLISQGMYQENQMNWVALFTIAASCFCIYLGLVKTGNKVEKI